MFESIMKFFNKLKKKEEKTNTHSKSADFLELMKQEIIEVIKKYIDIDEGAIDVRLTNKENEDGTNGAPALYANIPILNIKNEARKMEKKNEEQKENEQIESKDKEKENEQEEKQNDQEAKQNEEVEESEQSTDEAKEHMNSEEKIENKEENENQQESTKDIELENKEKVAEEKIKSK